jgi:hypothetical protein
MSNELEVKVAALEARNAENELLLEGLLKTFNPTATRAGMLADLFRERAMQAAARERADRRRAVLAMHEPARSEAVLEMEPAELALVYRNLGAPSAQHEFARGLSDAAYDRLLEALGNAGPALAFALGEVAEHVAVMVGPRTTIETPAGFTMQPGERRLYERAAWAHVIAKDEHVRACVEGREGDPVHFPIKPSIFVEAVSSVEARQAALAAWQKAGGPLPQRAAR